MLKAQIKTALSTGIDAIKTGMLSTEEVIETAGNAIAESGLLTCRDRPGNGL